MTGKMRRKVEDAALANDEKLNKISDKIYQICKKENLSVNEFKTVFRKAKKVALDNAKL